MNDVLHDDYDNCLIITLNRGKALNSLNHSMVQRLLELLLSVSYGKNIVVKGDLDRHIFCAGGDVKHILAIRNKDPKVFFDVYYHLFYRIATLDRIGVCYISILDGITMGGGCGISLHGKYRIGTENTVIAMPEAAIGFFPDVGSSYFLNKLTSSRMEGVALWMAITGAKISGYDTYSVGLTDIYIPSQNIPELIQDIIEHNGMIDEDIFQSKIKRKYHHDRNQQNRIKKFRSLLKYCFGDHHKSLSSVIESLKNKIASKNSDADDIKWAKEQLSIINNEQISIFSSQLTFHLFTSMRNKSVTECLKLDYAITMSILQQNDDDSDFVEGATAKLIEKRQPKWKYDSKTIMEMTPSRLLSMIPNQHSWNPKDINIIITRNNSKL